MPANLDLMQGGPLVRSGAGLEYFPKLRHPKPRLSSHPLMDKMNALGLAIVVGCAALVCSGLIFWLPTERRLCESKKSAQKNIEEIEGYIQQMRMEPGDPG